MKKKKETFWAHCNLWLFSWLMIFFLLLDKLSNSECALFNLCKITCWPFFCSSSQDSDPTLIFFCISYAHSSFLFWFFELFWAFNVGIPANTGTETAKKCFLYLQDRLDMNSNMRSINLCNNVLTNLCWQTGLEMLSLSLLPFTGCQQANHCHVMLIKIIDLLIMQ